MRCPYCAGTDTAVKDSRPAEDHVAIRRRRQCPDCGGRFTTFERVQLRDLTVLKSTGRREAFDRAKLDRSVRIALQKRAIAPERVDKMVSGIVRQLEQTGEAEVESRRIGEAAMDALARLDIVGYVRFASVYRNFQDVEDFDRFVAELRPAPSE
ncbi:MAG: transcriptional regulator NrdR [Paracoccaceae bacterium]